MERIRFTARTVFSRPCLRIWTEESPLVVLRPARTAPREGWVRFVYETDRMRPLRFRLIQSAEKEGVVEATEEHERSLKVAPGDAVPGEAWFVHGSGRTLLHDPFETARDNVRIHLITASRFRRGKLYIWLPGEDGTLLDPAGEDINGPYFDVTPTAERRHLFNFVFTDSAGNFQSPYANRTWSAADGSEVWTHSESPQVLTSCPVKRTLHVSFRHELGDNVPARMHIWQEGYGYAETIPGERSGSDKWISFRKHIYTGLPYGLMFLTGTPGRDERWEDDGARRWIEISADTERWTLEGDATLFDREPSLDREITIDITDAPPNSPVRTPDYLEVKLSRAVATYARSDSGSSIAPRRNPDDSWSLRAWPGVEISFRFGQNGQVETAYHTLRVPSTPGPIEKYATPGVPSLLSEPPPADRYRDPPFFIRRPGTIEEEGMLRFALHAPTCARVRLEGEWLPQGSKPYELKSTRDGTYWWAQVPVDEVNRGSPGGDYHGVRYRFILNDDTIVQDPAAHWVESSTIPGYSRLVRFGRYRWDSAGWRTPGWEYFTIYQLHPKRFTERNLQTGQALPPLLQVASEVERDAGYLRGIGATAVLLMPLGEFNGTSSWGYNPSYFYAVEESYGGPDALQRLVDACHKNGVAVFLDVVFNHAGTEDNILWAVARDSYFFGDTQWGALVNFGHPQCRHFFEQNLVSWAENFRIDGFRFDHTKTILEGGNPNYWYIRKPGSSAGRQFLHSLRNAVKSLDPGRIFMAEHLPNEWDMTGLGGPMDSQWCDEFHDRIADLSRGSGDKTQQFVDALVCSHTRCSEWREVVNYPESHDEVGNVNDRIANVAGFGQGYRRNKVAAAATLLSRGIPMWFMGCESAETKQFMCGRDDCLDLDGFENDPDRSRVREWWKILVGLRKNNNRIQGPSPLIVRFLEGLFIAFTRGDAGDYFVALNFGSYPLTRNLGRMNLPDGLYRELWNSSWPAFQVEWEDEHTNGGRDARLHRGLDLNVPDYGAVILEKI